ncbi:MarR family winged helix-turn-helix transcriptional regulator [Granulicella arctica]|uniref:MarR family winged helix-turn-helix transcriptional regulator n=1 Tax=Granulicella arctica TaxID=940613 RepID=UPI0021DF4E7B|nr:MarR family winged helix-turn-helix transcriptional regulator [Granulicella arctica]
MCELTEKTELEASRRQIARLMKRLMLHFRTEIDEQLRPFGATKAQIQLLWAIRSAPGSSGAHLARACEVTPQTMQALIQKTEESGWIVRGKDSVNDRIVTASLTAAGEELLVTADRVIKGIEAQLWQGVSPEAIETLSSVLEQCLANVTAT